MGGAETPGDRGRPALIAVAHGSRDPRSAATMHAVVSDVAAARPDLDVRLAFLDLSTPSVEQVVDAIAADGHTHAVVVPLLLGKAFHARVDLPGLLATAGARQRRLRLTQADVLGPDPRLIEALRDRVLESLTAGSSGEASHAASPLTSGGHLGVAVAAVGSSSAAANARTAAVARQLAARTGWDTEICFATTEPTVTTALSRLRDRGAGQLLVAPWFLAPGLLTDRLANAASDIAHTAAIGAHPLLTQVVLDRFDTAAALPHALTA
ncbi:sirohydrochlorin chelatase [Nocardia otitidiscaviarum]|uniref:sirohydrochlorin chelatase n=1 Tax=Nocardia otitidiscaviarum TaxID=1823 RepID=UPI002B4B5356|nr:sirohydrochlorin chelatase [Nocardia otitidiscaviarum]